MQTKSLGRELLKGTRTTKDCLNLLFVGDQVPQIALIPGWAVSSMPPDQEGGQTLPALSTGALSHHHVACPLPHCEVT